MPRFYIITITLVIRLAIANEGLNYEYFSENCRICMKLSRNMQLICIFDEKIKNMIYMQTKLVF